MSKQSSDEGVLRVDTSSDVTEPDTAFPIVARRDKRLSRSETRATANNQRQPSAAGFRGLPQQMGRWWAESILTVIVVSSALLSLFWVFKVPILQNPDENSHIDYAFSIYSAGRLLNVRRAPSGWNVHARPGTHKGAAWERISHQYT